MLNGNIRIVYLNVKNRRKERRKKRKEGSERGRKNVSLKRKCKEWHWLKKKGSKIQYSEKK